MAAGAIMVLAQQPTGWADQKGKGSRQVAAAAGVLPVQCTLFQGGTSSVATPLALCTALTTKIVCNFRAVSQSACLGEVQPAGTF